MALIEWKDKYNTEINTIDAQHRVLVDIINRFHEAMQNSSSRHILGEVLDELVQYTIKHFGTEEEIFNRINFSGTSAHKAEHGTFISDLQVIQRNYEKGTIVITVTLVLFLKDWLIKHIRGTDRLYIDAFKKAGIQ